MGRGVPIFQLKRLKIFKGTACLPSIIYPARILTFPLCAIRKEGHHGADRVLQGKTLV